MNSAGEGDDFVDYDSGPLVELEVDGVHYRLDPGKHGTSLCVSSRSARERRWHLLGEARWNGRKLRARVLEPRVLEPLADALASAAEQALGVFAGRERRHVQNGS